MQAIFFDLDGTLVELPDDFAGLFEATLSDLGLSVDDTEEYHQFYIEAFFDYFGDCHAEPYRQGMADLRAEFDLDPSADALADAYTEREAAATTLQSGVEETLAALDEADAPLGVLTNGGVRAQRQKLKYHGIADYFDAVVVSGDVGAGKPDPGIFAAARDAISAEEYVFVADDLERDVVPAQNSGFTGIHFVGDGELAADGDLAAEGKSGDDRADETIDSLGVVPNLLD